MSDKDEVLSAMRAAKARGDHAAAKRMAEILLRLDQEEGTESVFEKKQAPSVLDYVLDRGRKGLVSAAGAARGFARPDESPVQRQEHMQQWSDRVGYKGYRPVDEQSLLEKAAGGAGEAVANPFNYGGSGPVRTGAKLLRGVTENAAGGAGGDFGAQVAEEMGLPPVVGGLVGGAAGGYAAGRIARGPQTIGKAVDMVKNRGPAAVERAKMSQAEQHLQSFIAAAAKSDEGLALRIQQLINDNPALGIVELANNPVIRAGVAAMATKDPTWGAKFTELLDSAKAATRGMRTDMFGDPVKAKQVIQDTQAASKTAQAARMKDKLTARAQEASAPVGPYYNADNPVDQNTKMLTEREPARSPKAQSWYDKADSAAAAEGAAWKEGDTMDLYRFVKAEEKDSPYQRFPGVFDKIKNKAKPATDGKVSQWDPMDYTEVRSLQKEVNLELRRLNPASASYNQDYDALINLKKKIEEEINPRAFSPDVNNPLTVAGRQYAYDSALRDVGQEVVDMNGILDPKKLNNWLKNESNRRIMQNVLDPESGFSAGQVVDSAAAMTGRILQRRDLVEKIQTRMNQERILDVTKMTPEQIKDNMMTNDKFVTQVLKKAGHNKQNLQALRAFALDDLLEQPHSVKTLLEDRNRASAYDRLFGPNYSKAVKQFADISDKLANNPANIRFSIEKGVNQDLLQEFTGLSVAEVASKARNPIIGKTQAAILLLSKSMISQSGNEFESMLKQKLLQPEELAEALKIVKVAESGGEITESMLRKLLGWVGRTVKTAAGDSVRGARAGATVAQDRAFQPEEE